MPNGTISRNLKEAGVSLIFPSAEWLDVLQEKLNSDERYGEVAKDWEGDLLIRVEPAGALREPTSLYLDLWHGRCRKVDFGAPEGTHPHPTFILTTTYDHIQAILSGNLNPMTAMMTNRLRVKGNLGYMMRNVPTVLDFVRCAQEISTDIL